MKDLHDYRKSYQKGALDETDLPTHWIELFSAWFEQADQSEQIEEANAMHLSTLGLNGFPKSRVVLMKSFSVESLIFFTNYNSEKGKSIAQYNKVSVSFFWPSLEKQVIFLGTAEKLTASASDRYFYSRPVGSQKGAIVLIRVAL
jgi:Pyridoxamine-phosphate oxidase